MTTETLKKIVKKAYPNAVVKYDTNMQLYKLMTDNNTCYARELTENLAWDTMAELIIRSQFS